jgi:hypothetical protein
LAKSTLAIGDQGGGHRVVSWSDDGLLVAEYALFEAGDLVLRDHAAARASDVPPAPAGDDALFEAGYRTTARKALERLARAGITPSAAEDAARALSREVVRALARCEAARAVANRLGAAELLDGARFAARKGAYQGAWIDLKRLAGALDLPAASVLFQALYLAAALSELPGATPVFLSTSAALHGRRPAERTHVCPAMPAVDALFDALAGLATFATFDARPPDPVRERRLRPALLARIRERRDLAPPAVRHHLEALEAAFTAGQPDGRAAASAGSSRSPVRSAGPRSSPSPPGATEAQPPAEPPPAATEVPSTAIVLHASTLPSLDRLGGILAPSGEPPARYVPELVESLPLPHGADESLLDRYALPTTPLEARVAMTRLARELGRDYRVRHGKILRCDVMAVETMQLQLLRLAGAPLNDREVAWTLRRHGALLSEIFARALGGEWIDIGHKEAAYWMMRIGRDLHTRPIGSIFQFVAAGNRSGDLVGQFLELHKRRSA